MILRLKFDKGRPLQRKQGKNRHIALACGAFLTPGALMAYVLGVWRLGSDIGVASEFAIPGVFSHWQVWIGIGALLQLAAYSLNRYASSGRLEVPEVLAALPHRPSLRNK